MAHRKRLYVGDIFAIEVGWRESRGELAGRIRSAEWYDQAALAGLVDEIESAVTLDDYDWAWVRFLAWAENHGVVIDTAKRPVQPSAEPYSPDDDSRSG